MISTLTVLAAGGITWTPLTYYVAAAIAHLLIILLAFRIFGLNAEHNTFGGALLVAIGLNVTAFFTKDFGIVGVLAPASVLFALLAFIARGDVIKSIMVWFLVMASYLGLSHLIIPNSEDLRIEDLGGIPQVLDDGGLTPQGFTEDDFDNLSRGGEDDEPGR